VLFLTYERDPQSLDIDKTPFAYGTIPIAALHGVSALYGYRVVNQCQAARKKAATRADAPVVLVVPTAGPPAP
jgi:hypothetical protein